MHLVQVLYLNGKILENLFNLVLILYNDRLGTFLMLEDQTIVYNARLNGC